MSERARRTAAVLAVLTFLLGSCSDEPTTAKHEEGVAPEAQETPAAGSERADGKMNDGKHADDDEEGKGFDGTSRAGSEEGRARDDSARSRKAGDTDAPDSGSYPAAGTYVYRQDGFEEFCQTASCERENLPEEQRVETRYKERTETHAVVVSEARTSDNRLARTTFEFDRDQALITDVYTRFTYQNVRFEDSYHPDPPVRALRFPLRVGDSWSGRWKDKTSGTYDISVRGRERIEAAGRTIEAFRIETEVRFEGQFEGTSTAVVWFDPATKTAVQSEGEMSVRSAFGRYRTEFAIVLDSGPAY